MNEMNNKNNTNKNDDETKIFNIVKEEDPKPLNLPVKKKKRSLLKGLINVSAALVVLIIIAGLIVGIFGITIGKRMMDEAPELDLYDFVSNESTKIYDGNGELIIEIGTYLRENITYESCPEGLIDAFLSIEDSRYFQHFGFDIPRFAKAALENLKTMSFGQGGSTFTMQLVKNTYFQVDSGDSSTLAEKKIDRKVQEIYLAIQLDKQLDKKTILELYLNKINFGGNIRGVQKASMYYFGKEVSQLSLSEQAMLAGIVNRPNAYNPYNYLDLATSRRNTVLDMMVYHGYITKEEADLAKSIKIEDQLIGENVTISDPSDNTYRSYIDVVINEAQAMTGKDPFVTGMTIYTSMNRDVQATIDSIQDGSAEIPFPDDLMQVALITINNKTGEILGIGGGRNYDGARLLNRATSQFKQPGSAVKGFLSYALGFEYLGYTDQMVLTDRPITYPMESRVIRNFDRQYRGDVTIQQAFAQSLNIPAILVLQEVVEEIGQEAVVSYMRSIGFTKVTNDNFHLSFAIGGTLFETTVLEMAGAQATMLNGGIYNKPHTITKLVLQNGEEYFPTEQNRKIISSGSAYLVTQLLQYAVEGPYFNYMQILKRNYPVYAKTGTTDWGSDGLVYGIPKGAAKDKWMLSSTSEYTNAVWLGYDKGVKDQQTYYTAAKSRLNLPGRVSKLLLDTLEDISTELPGPVVKPDDVEQITYVYGTWPYAAYEDWMDPRFKTTANVSRAGKKELVSIYDHQKEDNTFNGVSATILEDGTLQVNWSVGSGSCFGDTKDISLYDNWNNITAYGTCLFDYSWVIGSSGYFGASVYNDDYYLADIVGYNGYYAGWPGDLWGTVKVCGWYNDGVTTSETKCTIAGYSYSNEWTE